MVRILISVLFLGLTTGCGVNSTFVYKPGAQGVKVYPHMLRKRFTTTAKLLCPGFVVDILTSHIPTGSVTDKNYTIPSPEELRPFTEIITAELLRMAEVEYTAL